MTRYDATARIGGAFSWAPGPTLEVFVPGALCNYANGRVAWRTEAAYRKRWRQGTALVLRPRVTSPPDAPKRVHLLAATFNLFDDDGLRNACKPLVDGLVDAGVLHSDAPGSGHLVTYAQRIDRAHRGVRITITPRSAPSPGDHAHAPA